MVKSMVNVKFKFTDTQRETSNATGSRQVVGE